MEVTKEELQRRFKEYNDLYFDGKLGKCRFYFLSKNCGIYGKYIHPTKSNGEKESRIGINRGFHYTDETLRILLVHEMIHMYVATIEGVEVDGLFGHGWRFRRQRRRIKKTFGIDVMQKI